ncbi:MAG: radical SAM protein [Synergistaceae bacterium]|nr:radical SAM protein [Synergistaceae bacterium]
MFFRLNDRILFRQYTEFGYLTDNSMFGYRFLNEDNLSVREKYISESGSVMLGMLSRTPQDLDSIVRKLIKVFTDVDYETLRQDTLEFFIYLASEGYLCCGESSEACNSFGHGSYNFASAVSEDYISEPYNFLRSIHVETTTLCNERCLHCYIPHGYKNKLIDPLLLYKILEEGRAMNIINVTFSGGEPMMHPEFLSFLRRSRELDLSVNVLTNLTLLTREIIAEMANNPMLSVQTSLYSMNADVHDSITQLRGSFEKTKSAVLKLLSQGIHLQISCPIMKHNKDSFSSVIEWAGANNIPAAVNHVIFASYDNSNTNLVNRLSIDDLSVVIDKQISADYVSSLRETAREKYLLTGDSPICSVFRYYLCVSADGDVFPCAGWQSKKVGNLRTQTIREIWEEASEVRYLRQIKRRDFPKCVSCEDRGYCTVCMMVNANENSGDIFRISDFHCRAAAMTRAKINSYGCNYHQGCSRE